MWQGNQSVDFFCMHIRCMFPLTLITGGPFICFFFTLGEWLYVVNIPGKIEYQQGIVVEECL